MKSLRVTVEVIVPNYCEDGQDTDDIINEAKEAFRKNGLPEFLEWDSDYTLMSVEVFP